MTAMLKVKKLQWQQHQKTLLQDISFNVEQGEVIGVIGPNGAGKTSLLRCIEHNINDFNGTIEFDQQNIRHYDRRQLAQRMAVVAQLNQPIFSLSVFDVTRMGLLPHKNFFATDNDTDRHKIKLALAKVGLANKINDSFGHLSGGEQQRALIARALVQGAQLLIMDEPTNHLDVFYQHQIMQLVKALKITVIMTVHDLNLAAQHCQRLLLIDKGQLIVDGSPDQVLQAKVLSAVFKLPCVRDQDPYNDKPRVSFHLATDGSI